jgi:hypothetical protein
MGGFLYLFVDFWGTGKYNISMVDCWGIGCERGGVIWGEKRIEREKERIRL